MVIKIIVAAGITMNVTDLTGHQHREYYLGPIYDLSVGLNHAGGPCLATISVSCWTEQQEAHRAQPELSPNDLQPSSFSVRSS